MLISVIIPVYNVEKYLRRCVESVLRQTHKEIEIFLIDDGSTDNSGKICDELEKEDNRIKTVHISNGGAARARNIGLDRATGEYISFIDSDDWILPMFLENLLQLCLENNADISKCEVIDVKSEQDIIPNIVEKKNKIYSPLEILNQIYIDRKLFNVAIMNKLYKKTIFEKIRFEEGIINEDEEILCKIIMKANKIVITNEIMYCYFLSDKSVTRSNFRKQNLDIMKCFDSRIQQLQGQEYNDVLQQTYADYMKILGQLYYKVYTYEWKDKNKYLDEIKEKINDLKERNKKNKYFSFEEKMKIIMRLYCVNLVKICYKIKYGIPKNDVGIITINDDNNYGNRLQNYALQAVINKKDFTMSNIVNLNDERRSYINQQLSRIKKSLMCIININKRERKRNFKIFNKNKIKKEKMYINNIHKERKALNKYNKFVIGSDQIWNPHYIESVKVDFALFAPKEKVISYAASFGVNDIPEDKKEFFIKGLNNVSKISVREERGAEIVKELTGREAQVVLDPTLLLDKEDWEEVIKKPKNVPRKKYILTYFLGNISEERKNKFEKLAEESDYEIVNLGKIEYPEYFIAGPSEFLWYFENAEIIFTDSFHACVFSIIFDKTFYYMNREDKSVSMNSRIETLLKTFELQDRKFENWEKVTLEHNYSQVEEILKREREKSLKFLDEALA